MFWHHELHFIMKCKRTHGGKETSKHVYNFWLVSHKDLRGQDQDFTFISGYVK